ncbi:MAG: hypothetical protein ABDH32_03160 [Candidatus Caldarchaeales archaeon]
MQGSRESMPLITHRTDPLTFTVYSQPNRCPPISYIISEELNMPIYTDEFLRLNEVFHYIRIIFWTYLVVLNHSNGILREDKHRSSHT